MNDLVEFLRAQLDEAERVARAAQPGPWTMRDNGGSTSWTDIDAADGSVTSSYEGEVVAVSDAEHIARWDPARVLAEIEAKRRILDAWRPEGSNPHPGIPCENWPGQGGENRDPYDSCCHHLAAPRRTPDHVVHLLAQPYAGKPGWREEWAVTT